MDDRDRTEMQALCDLFRRAMACKVGPPVFDQESRERVGDMIGRSARHGRPYHAYTSPRP